MNREEYAVKLHKAPGINCAQAVACAFADVMDLTEEQASKLASAFGGGFSGEREVCGAISGMCMVLGMLKSKGNDATIDDKKEMYTFSREQIEKFRQKFETIRCGELLSSCSSKGVNCGDFIKYASHLLNEIINENTCKNGNNNI